MRESLDRLMELQEVDLKLSEIEELRGNLPQEVESLKQDLEETKQTLKESDKRIKEINSSIRDIEANITQADTKLKKYKEQLYAVTTNKEYDALTDEIESLQNAINESENQTLDLMTERETSEEESKNSHALSKEIEQDLKSRTKELNKRINETEYLKKRDKITPKIAQSMISKYERIREARNGRAVVPIVRSSCGGCFHRLPPQLIVEVKKMEKIINCESCGRVLVHQEIAVEN